MIQVQATLQGAMDVLTGFLTAHASAGAWYTALVRFLFPILAVLILLIVCAAYLVDGSFNPFLYFRF